MIESMNKKVCVVTGASSGLGRATSIILAKKGAKLVLADRDNKGGEETLNLVISAGTEAVFQKTDVSKSGDVQALVQKTLDTFGRLDCAVNNAGIEGERNKIGDFSEAGWNQIIGINLTGVFLCMKYEIPALIASGGGSIVNIGSTASISGVATMPAYVAAKHGVLGMTRTVAMDYGADNIRVNSVLPGSFRTPMSERLYGNDNIEDVVKSITPLNRLGSAEECAEAVVWLCSDQSSWVSGAGLSVDGGSLSGQIIPGGVMPK